MIADPLPTQVGLHDVQVETIDTAGGSFDATFWLQLEWTDRRLEWNPRIYNGTIQRVPGSIWEPQMYIQNMKTSQMESRIYETSATVSRFVEQRITQVPAAATAHKCQHSSDHDAYTTIPLPGAT